MLLPFVWHTPTKAIRIIICNKFRGTFSFSTPGKSVLLKHIHFIIIPLILPGITSSKLYIIPAWFLEGTHSLSVVDINVRRLGLFDRMAFSFLTFLQICFNHFVRAEVGKWQGKRSTPHFSDRFKWWRMERWSPAQRSAVFYTVWVVIKINHTHFCLLY